MAVFIDYGLLFNQRDVIQTCNTPAVGQIERRDGRVGAIIRVREVGPDALVHGMERLRAVHEREGGDFGQVELDQLGVDFLQRGFIRLTGDLLD